MIKNKATRKKRSDRMHVIYCMTCEKTGKQYVGTTVIRFGNVEKSIQIRMTQHLHRAWIAESDRVLPVAMRKYAKWSIEKMMVIRGKTECFATESAIINSMKPELNMTKKK